MRDLERRFAESGSVEDEAALLLARSRAGVLRQHGLQIAAYAGHPAARLAVGGPLIDEALGGIAAWGKPPSVVVAAAVARVTLPLLEDLVGWPGLRTSVEGALVAIDDWLAAPSEAKRQVAKDMIPGTFGPIRHALRATSRADRTERERTRAAKLAARDAAEATQFGLVSLSWRADPEASHEPLPGGWDVAAAALWRSVCEALWSWALSAVAAPNLAPERGRPPRGHGLYGCDYLHFGGVLVAGSKRAAGEQVFRGLAPLARSGTSARAIARSVGRVCFSPAQEVLWFRTARCGSRLVPPSFLDEHHWSLISRFEPPGSLADSPALGGGSLRQSRLRAKELEARQREEPSRTGRARGSERRAQG